jgi:predicted ribosome quality control (RQC) complex YloA/Tae2 family protein
MEDAGFARGDERTRIQAAAELDRELSDVLRAVSRAHGKASRRARAVAGDLEVIDEAQAWAARAPWLVAEAAKAPRGATALRVPDWTTGVEIALELPLDPSRSAREQVVALFAEARRLRRGRDRVEARLERARADEAKLASLAADLRAAGELARGGAADVDLLAAELASLRDRARALLPRGAALAGAKAPREAERRPYREFVVSGDLRVWVGKDAKSNDELTLHVAKPHHVWLHAKGRTGSHVIACVGKGHALTPDQLVDAAHLAAHFSDARGEAIVEVSYLPKRYLRKPRKSPPGAVVLDREKVLVLRVDPERRDRLLHRAPPIPITAPSPGADGERGSS